MPGLSHEGVSFLSDTVIAAQIITGNGSLL